jgi:two-component system, chemotaxis family, protein-glutamate methylesterase/glutaminase
MNRDIVTIGASAGGVAALQQLVRTLPVELPAAVFAVVHAGPGSDLAAALRGSGGFPVATAEDEVAFARGTLYVAPPDRHLLINAERMLLRRSPRENMARPAIDPLFRSAARYHGTRAIGVLLTGNLTDGAAGIEAIKRCGGRTIVQDPADAAFPGMPSNAIETVDVDHVEALSRLPALLVRLTREEAGPATAVPPEIEWETRVAEGYVGEMTDPGAFGPQSVFSCPDCGGPLWEIDREGAWHFRCFEGHAYTPDALLQEQGAIIEKALASAIRAHRERAALARRMATSARRHNRTHSARAFEERARDYERDADVIRQLMRRDTNAIEGAAAPADAPTPRGARGRSAAGAGSDHRAG